MWRCSYQQFRICCKYCTYTQPKKDTVEKINVWKVQNKKGFASILTKFTLENKKKIPKQLHFLFCNEEKKKKNRKKYRAIILLINNNYAVNTMKEAERYYQKKDDSTVYSIGMVDGGLFGLRVRSRKNLVLFWNVFFFWLFLVSIGQFNFISFFLPFLSSMRWDIMHLYLFFGRRSHRPFGS